MVKKISQWQVIREYDKYIIIYNNQKFCFDLNNVKLDVVPLCKIITECCWRSICEIDNYIDKYYPKASKKSQKDNEIRSRKLDEISEMFLNFIEIHFDLRTFR